MHTDPVSPPPAIEARGLKKSYRARTVVDIEALRIEPGERFGLVGNNGAGKTTFFRMALDLVRPDQGEVLSRGRSVHRTEEWKAYTGAYLDEGFLVDFLTPEEYFEFVGGLHGYSAAAVHAIVEGFADLFNEEILGQGKYIRDLSQGNQKKVGIAAALVASPEIVVFDEPFANLDPTTTIRLIRLLRRLADERRTTLLISSHDLNHITEVCARIAVLEGGRIVRDVRTNQSTLAELRAYFTDGPDAG